MNQDPSRIEELLRKSRHILVIKLRYLGDSVWMLPFVENLKRNLPHVKVSVLVNKGTESFFYQCPAVDGVFPFPRNEVKGGFKGLFRFAAFMWKIRKEKPDTVIDLTDGDRAAVMGFLSGARVRILYTHMRSWHNWLFTHIVRPQVVRHMLGYHLDFLQHMGLQLFDATVRIRTGKQAIHALSEKLPSLLQDDQRKKVVLHIGARTPLRQWGTGRFARLCDLLTHDYRVFLTAGPGEQQMLDEVLAQMQTRPEFCSSHLGLEEFAALCELSDIFVGNDSGPIHIASAKTFVVGIYGPTNNELAGPWTNNKVIFEVDSLECRPCTQEGCSNQAFKACLNLIIPEEVAAKVREVLERRVTSPDGGTPPEGPGK
jgi:ADP-heptose:LPS heptosyltransferase